MKKYNLYYYLLFVLLIMGAFASMAQNVYGLYILGGVAIAFAAIFGYQFYEAISAKTERNRFGMIESASLFVCAAIFAMRVFYVHFLFVEFVFILSIVVLVFCYVYKMIGSFMKTSMVNRNLAYIILSFHMAIICYLISLLGFAISPALAFAAGMVALVFSIIFVAAGWLAGSFMFHGEKVTAFAKAARFRDHSVLLLALFFLFTLYAGFIRYNILPPVYSEELPQAYFKLVNESDSGKKTAEQLRTQSAEFKRNYDDFLKKNFAANSK